MPTLDAVAFRKNIKAKRLAPVYLFVGEDVRMIQSLVGEIEATIDPADRAFAVDRLFAGDPGGAPVDVVASARGLPMLGDRRIVIVLRAERWLKPKRSSKSSEAADETEGADGDESEDAAADMGAIEDYLAAPSPSTTLVLVATAVDKSRRLTKRVREKADEVECGAAPPKGLAERRDATSTAATWVRAEMTRVGRTIDAAAVTLLLERRGLDVNGLRGDVERLVLYTEGRTRVASDDVEEVVAAQTVIADDWAVVNAIAEGNVALALREVALRLDRGDSPHGLVGQLRWWVSSRLAEGEPGRVAAALDALFKTDLALKSSAGDDRVLIERLVVGLTGRALPKRGWK